MDKFDVKRVREDFDQDLTGAVKKLTTELKFPPMASTTTLYTNQSGHFVALSFHFQTFKDNLPTDYIFNTLETHIRLFDGMFTFWRQKKNKEIWNVKVSGNERKLRKKSRSRNFHNVCPLSFVESITIKFECPFIQTRALYAEMEKESITHIFKKNDKIKEVNFNY